MTNEHPTHWYLRCAFGDNGLVELRHQDGDRWTSGLFDKPEDLLNCARALHKSGNLFISLNRPSPHAATNCMGGEPLGNADFQWITRLFFDFDPVRGKDIASTQAELDLALGVAREVRHVLNLCGWPDPLIAISGNGVHLLYRCHLPNTAEIRDMLSTVYGGLYRDHSNECVTFDRVVRNPGRIGPLYGSVKRKGPSTTERPHRKSRIIEYPIDWRQVPCDRIAAVSNFYAKRLPVSPTKLPVDHSAGFFFGSGDYNTLDVVAWFKSHGLYRRSLGGYGSSQRHTVRCPWEGEHSVASLDSDTSTVIFDNSAGWPGFHCAHDHCHGRKIQDVMTFLGDADQFCRQKWMG